MGLTHSPWAWIVIAVVLLVLFGGKKLPDAARGLGRSMRIFKSEMEEMKNEGEKGAAAKPQPQVADKPIDVQTVDAPNPSEADRRSA